MMSNLCPIAVCRQIINENQPKTASEALLAFVRKKRLCDVTFTFENSAERIEAHQLCLRSRSPVFDSIFRGRGSVSEMVEFKVEDVQPNVFRKFLEFIYLDKLDVTQVEALHLNHLGQKYKVQPLIEKSETLLGERIPLENAVEMYETAHKYGILCVKKQAADVIIRSLEQLLQEPQLLGAKEATLMELLQRDDLRVKEVDLFRFVVRWGQQASPNREHLPQVLSPLFSKLRYTNMTPKEFTTVVMPTKLIPADDALEIFTYLNGDRSTRAALISTFKYNTSCRCGKLDEVFNFYETGILHEDDQPKGPSWCEGENPFIECISFNVRGVGASRRSCPHSMYKSHSKLQLKSIQVQWPLLLSEKVDKRPSIRVVILKTKPNGDEDETGFPVSLVDYKVGCVADIPMDPPVDICEEVKYSIFVCDELWFSESSVPKYRYSSDSAPFGQNLKPNVVGGCLKNVEVCNIDRNDCLLAVCNASEYDRIHVIRGMQLEFTHDNPTD